MDNRCDRYLAFLVILMLFFSVASFGIAVAAPVGESVSRSSVVTADTVEGGKLFGIGAEGWTAIFTCFLTLSTLGLWGVTALTSRRSERALKIVERAYLFPDLRDGKCFQTDGKDLKIFLKFRNSGKTPAMAYEIYGEIRDDFPSQRVYPKDNARCSIDISVGASDLGELGSAYANILGKICIGYVKYRDVFGAEHITGFALQANDKHNQWEAVTNQTWSYWT